MVPSRPTSRARPASPPTASAGASPTSAASVSRRHMTGRDPSATSTCTQAPSAHRSSVQASPSSQPSGHPAGDGADVEVEVLAGVVVDGGAVELLLDVVVVVLELEVLLVV